MSSVSLTERSMSVLLHVFRYSYSSPACSNSTQDFSVPQRSSGVKKPEQRNVSHRLGPDAKDLRLVTAKENCIAKI